MKVVADGPTDIQLPSHLDVLIESPSLSFLTAATQFSKLMSTGRMGLQEARLRLLALGVEECASYALNPCRPGVGESAYGVAPSLAAAELVSYLSSASQVRGLPLAREMAGLVFDRSASEMETYLCAALSLPVHVGGLGLPVPELNASIDLMPEQKLALNHTHRLTPDLLWRELGLALEYLGKLPHGSKEAQDEDAGRFQDYDVLGIRAMPVRYLHVSTQQALMEFARRLACVMEQCGAKGTLAWIDELAGDDDWRHLQRVLMMTLLPAVRDERV